MLITAAAVTAAGVLVAGVTAVSNASTTGQAANTGYSVPGYQGGEGGQGRGMGGHTHTAVTGTELDKVKAAVKAKDSSITVQSVQKDPDGSYDVMGTKSGSPVMVEVSKDLKTIEVRTGGPGHGKGGGMGGHTHTAVTGTELDKVKAAVKAKDSSITGPVRPEGPRRLLRRHGHQERQPGHGRGEQGPQDHRGPHRRPRPRHGRLPRRLG